jgi:prepilin-type N-terminal cleavage/methylation domain-containing protein
MSRRSERAFTLIELVIVVALIALIAGVLVPAAISRMQRTERPPSSPMRQAPPLLAALGGRGIAPRIADAEVRIRLIADPVLDGLRVENRYRAAFRGTFVVESADPDADAISIAFPLPAGTTEARDVSLSVREGTRLVEPSGVRYSTAGIEWTTEAPKAPITLVVTYEAAGKDAFSYDVLGGGRADRLLVEVALENAPEVDVPAESLTPTEMREDTLVWRLEHAVASRPIVVELPAGSSSLGKLILMFQLAALGVLSFGAGFWYLSEGAKPGRLDGFRWGHFLLLALNYSLFFVVFGVVVYGGSPVVALAAASVSSLPLLVLHVARVLDLSFALRSVLPLAAFSLGTVVGAVYLPEHRALLLLGSLLVAMAYVTATHRGFVARRKAASAAALARSKERTLAEAPPGFDHERITIEAARDPYELEAAKAGLRAAARKAKVEVDEALSKLETVSHAAAILLETPIAGDAPAAIAAKEVSAKLAGTLELARRVQRDAATTAPRETAARALRIGATIGIQHESLASALSALSRSASGGARHCAACGSAREPNAPFCPDCGTPRAHAIDCAGCGATFRVPVRVAKRKWRSEALHCERCGHGLVDRSVGSG